MLDRLLATLAIGLARLAMRVEVTGTLPAAPPALLVGNHGHRLLDPVALVTVFGRRIRFLTGADLLALPVVGRVLASGFAIRVEASLPGLLSTADEALAAARGGFYVGVFPEGRDARAGHGTFKHGAAWLALRLGCPIVPVFIERLGTLRWRLSFGGSFRPEADRIDSRTTRALTDRIRAAIWDLEGERCRAAG